jgi:hypothetical protein
VKGQIELVLRWACPCENNEELQVVSRLPAWANYAMGEATFREAWAQFAGEIKAHSPAAPSVEQDERGAFDEIRSALDETYGFASTSPRAQENINFISEKLSEIEKARAASTSANVAQGAETFDACQFCATPNTCGEIGQCYRYPPAQTALTATCGQLIAACTAYNEEMRKRNTANVGMAVPDAMRKAIDAAMTAAQSASGETKCGQ